MSAIQIILGSFQLLFAALLTAAIAFQSSPEGGMGTITGDSGGGFFRRGKAKTLDKKLAKATVYLSAGFIVLTIVLGLTA